MPYNSVSELPANVRKLAPVRKRQWMHVFNSSFRRHHDEGRAIAEAWAVVNREKELELQAEEILTYSVKDLTKHIQW